MEKITLFLTQQDIVFLQQNIQNVVNHRSFCAFFMSIHYKFETYFFCAIFFPCDERSLYRERITLNRESNNGNK